MLTEFLKIITNDMEKPVDIKHLFDKKADRVKWEKMVNIFETIRIDSIVEGLEEINSTYKLDKTEEITIIAYVKFLERMLNMAGRVSNSDIEAGSEERKQKKPPEFMYG